MAVSQREMQKALGVKAKRTIENRIRRGMPMDSVESARAWCKQNVGVRRGSGVATRLATKGSQGSQHQVRTESSGTQPAGTHSDDDCGLTPNPLLTAHDGARFYVEHLADADIVQLSEYLQDKVSKLVQLIPAQAEAVRRAIRATICHWSGSTCCPHCRRVVGIVEPPEPEDEPEAPRRMSSNTIHFPPDGNLP